MDVAGRAGAVEAFEQNRAKLTGLAYRLLGRTGEAEEVVQDAFLRWFSSDREAVREPAAFLVTAVTRLALDRLKSARARREEYVGPWLPEPVVTDDDGRAAGPLDAIERGDLMSIGMLRLLERLSAAERGVFVLREAFDLSYEEIATVLGLEPANCRQLYARAQKHLSEDRSRFEPSREEHARLVAAFRAALEAGSLEGLRALLSEGVVAYNDGGGRVRAARKPVRGAERVARFFVGFSRKYPAAFTAARAVEINGRLGLVVNVGGDTHVLNFEFDGGRLRNVYDVANPDKLARLERQLLQRATK